MKRAAPDPIVFRRAVLRWSTSNERDLPWRRRRDPYAVWISEVMLQQTTVATVIPRFARWMKRFPDVSSLAAASERAVIREWEGLGYYARARNIRKAARIIVKSGGRIPGDYDALRALPGIGDYTASAILSICFGEQRPALDANLRRILQRYLLHERWTTSTEQAARRFMESALPAQSAGRLNEALMDLGSLVCLPREPRCEICPVMNTCTARRKASVNEIPHRRARSVTELEANVPIKVHSGMVLVRRRQPGEIGTGLWSFPEIACDRPKRKSGPSPATIGHMLPKVTHSYTRFRKRLNPHVAFVTRRDAPAEHEAWVAIRGLERLPFLTAHRRIALALRRYLDTL